VTSDAIGTVVSHLRRSEIFRDYQNAFEITTGLPLDLRQAGSFNAPLHGSKRLNPFCAAMAHTNKSCAACLQLQQRVEDQATHEPKTLECFSGLSGSAVAVRVGQTVVGFLQTGLSAGSDEKGFQAHHAGLRAREHGIFDARAR
jgi:hypothetical protein